MRYTIGYEEFLDYLEAFNEEFPHSYISDDAFDETDNFEVVLKQDESYDILVGGEFLFNTEGTVADEIYDDFNEEEDWYQED